MPAWRSSSVICVYLCSSVAKSSCEYFADRLAAMSDRDRAAGVVADRHCRVDPQALVHGGTDVAGANWLVLDVGGVGVGGAVDRAALDAAARHEDAETVSPVIAPAVGIDL